jgi:hypothetical protein
VSPEQFIRYLAAKRTVDDRALNRVVWRSLERELAATGSPSTLEIGFGIGTMLERALEWRLIRRGTYTGVDSSAFCIEHAERTLPDRLRALGLSTSRIAAGHSIRGGDTVVDLEVACADLFDRPRRYAGRRWDLLLAHAFTDLLDVPTALPVLLSLLVPGGLFSFSIVFDGTTALEPAVDPVLDECIERVYHRTMDERLVNGRLSGDSRSGRHLFGHLARAGARVLEAGSSGWVVHARDGIYPADEAYFLRAIVDTVVGALASREEIDPPRLAEWRRLRHEQIERGALVYVAHQLDVLGRAPV